MTKILLVRHGHVEGIDPPRFRGRTELPLTEFGVRQAAHAAKWIARKCKLTAVYTSPMGRCVATAEAIAHATGAPLHVLDGLNDIDYGAWQWQTYDEVKRQDPGLFARWFSAPHLIRFPDGDSLQDLAARAADALRWVLNLHPDDVVVMVGHDSVNRALLLQLLDQPLSAYWRLGSNPCGISEVDITDDGVCVLHMNETQHLDGVV